MTRDKAVHYSSASDDWGTPQDFFDQLDAEFHFTLDVCATPENAKCSRFFTPENDGLLQDWGGEVVWMNPPYGRTIARWMAKAVDATTKGATVVCLVHSRTDTRWWHDYAEKASERRFVKGRLKFGGSKNFAPFPSAIVIFRPLCGVCGGRGYTLAENWPDIGEAVSLCKCLTEGDVA